MFGKKVKTEVKVEGMHCGHCAAKVETAVKALNGVKSVKADPQSGSVEIVSASPLDLALVAQAVERIGFKMVQ